jgi:FRG1-like family.
MVSFIAFAQDSYWDFADQVVTIKTHHGKYLSVDVDGKVTASKDTTGAKEHFYLKPMSDTASGDGRSDLHIPELSGGMVQVRLSVWLWEANVRT